jgi:hypothetical protein
VKSFLLIFTVAFASLAQAQLTKGDAIKATTTVHPDGTRSTLVVDPSKATAEEIFYDGGQRVLRKIVYPLDAQNQSIGAITYDAKGTIVSKSSYKRDETGRIAEETITSNSGQFLRRRVYSYSSQNRISRVDEFDATGQQIMPPPRAAKTSPGRPDKKRR